ncbi:cobalamin-dependent protein, partial [bacterium]|nr:cobalamin-dependent protein [bacterium]
MRKKGDKKTVKIGFHLVFSPKDISYHYPLAFSYLKSYLERNFNINFTTVLLNSKQDVFFEKNMDIFGICTYSQDFDDAIRITDKLKEDNPDLIILMGGQHILHFPKTLPKSVDIGVIGEGEITFLELISLY